MCTKSYGYWIFDCLVIGSYWQADRWMDGHISTLTSTASMF